jgi:hypothetical protein
MVQNCARKCWYFMLFSLPCSRGLCNLMKCFFHNSGNITSGQACLLSHHAMWFPTRWMCLQLL